MKKILLVCAIAIGAVLFYLANRHHDERPPAVAGSPSPTSEKPDASSMAKTGLAQPTTAPAAGTPRNAASTFTQAYNDRNDWPGLYRQLKAAAPTAETQWLQALLLTACAKRGATPASITIVGAPPPPTGTREERRTNFVASLAASDPQRDKRIAAYDAANTDVCRELSQLDYDAGAVQKLIDAAAAGGDPRARAQQLAQQIEDAGTAHLFAGAAKGGAPNGIPLTDAQFTAMRELLASRDPMVIGELKAALSSTIVDATLRLGPQQEAIDKAAFYAALGLLACDYGARCDRNSPALLVPCASKGFCGADNLADHVYTNVVPSSAAQLVEQYRQQLGQMLASGDLSQLSLVRGTSDAGRMYLFSRRGG